MNDAPTFRSLEHCLAVAYLMEIATAYPKSGLGKILDQLLRTKYGIETDTKEGPNWDGLSPLDIRGTCVMIRSACKRLLFPIEYDMVLAKFSNVPEDRDKAIQRLALYAQENLHIQALPVIADMVGRAWSREGKSRDKIARSHGVGHGSVDRDCERIKNLLGAAWREVSEELGKVFIPEKLY